jgi:hypothetical protein
MGTPVVCVECEILVAMDRELQMFQRNLLGVSSGQKVNCLGEVEHGCRELRNGEWAVCDQWETAALRTGGNKHWPVHSQPFQWVDVSRADVLIHG